MTQAEALKILKTGRSVFITGPAGAGKTYLLREYIKWLKDNDINVAVTASTGIASTHMGGITIHSWSGVGIKDTLTQNDIEELTQRKYLRERIYDTKVLIIDEISMLHDFRIDMIDRIVRSVKGIPEPFGGMQVIFSGDFFQLPPITRARFDEGESQLFDEERSNFAYHSPSWKSLDPAICYLEEQHRQEDNQLLKILNAFRDRRADKSIREILHTRKIDSDSKRNITKLYAKNISVDRENEQELSKLDGEVFEYQMTQSGNPKMCEALKKSCLAPEILCLKVGAKVMFVKNNFEKEYVNGTQGEVFALSEFSIKVKTFTGTIIDVPIESWRIEEDGKKKAEISQYPLRLAWAITVHKSQGMSLDEALIDLSDAFAPGMGYVALSRLRSLNGLYLVGIGEGAYMMHDEVADFDEKFRIMSEDLVREISALEEAEISRTHNTFISKNSDKKIKEKKKPTHITTRELFEDGLTLSEIAKERNLTIGTIIGHMEENKENDPIFNTRRIIDDIGISKYKTISGAFHKVGTVEGGKRPLTPVFELLNGKYDYDTLKIVRLCL